MSWTTNILTKINIFKVAPPKWKQQQQQQPNIKEKRILLCCIYSIWLSISSLFFVFFLLFFIFTSFRFVCLSKITWTWTVYIWSDFFSFSLILSQYCCCLLSDRSHSQVAQERRATTTTTENLRIK